MARRYWLSVTTDSVAGYEQELVEGDVNDNGFWDCCEVWSAEYDGGVVRNMLNCPKCGCRPDGTNPPYKKLSEEDAAVNRYDIEIQGRGE